MRTDSSQFEQFTLGIEEEFQIVDPNTHELRSHVSEILEEGRMLLGEQVKPEMIQSMIEVGTGICKDIKKLVPISRIFAASCQRLCARRGWRLSPPALIHSRTGRTKRSSRMQDMK